MNRNKFLKNKSAEYPKMDERLIGLMIMEELKAMDADLDDTAENRALLKGIINKIIKAAAQAEAEKYLKMLEDEAGRRVHERPVNPTDFGQPIDLGAPPRPFDTNGWGSTGTNPRRYTTTTTSTGIIGGLISDSTTSTNIAAQAVAISNAGLPRTGDALTAEAIRNIGPMTTRDMMRLYDLDYDTEMSHLRDELSSLSYSNPVSIPVSIPDSTPIRAES